ncbi:hypothetical protein N7519_004261 [Penicillium mononematosum]|uniref:uncharacterized protein n=1 Tax=Penicillium mononematosum TaxID=268346 RepID=UPI0025483EE8|nr:uncharacterized protein N7519_004261 [Penicillium mononematosum]KAJ6189353.1 hypothetical protein N7519_004261 [Penicillium mononematosum]
MSKIWLPVRTRPMEHSPADTELQPLNAEWTLAHCFCFIMGGIALQTQDEWIYSAGWGDIHLLIQAGVIPCSDIRDRDIEDRSKADWIGSQRASRSFRAPARRVHYLPISLIELTAVACVLCGILTYGFWWCKPKDMATPVIVPPRCNRQDMNAEIGHATDVKPGKWVHLQACIRNDSVISALSELYHERKLLNTPLASTTWLNEELARQEHIFIISDVIGSVVALSFCAVHLAACRELTLELSWNFKFPTKAEQTSWRAFTIVSVASIFIYCLLMMMQDVCMWLRWKEMLPSFFLGFDSLNHFSGSILNFAVWHCGSRFLILEIASGGVLQGYSVGDVYTAFLEICGLMPQQSSHLLDIQTGISSDVIRAPSITVWCLVNDRDT